MQYDAEQGHLGRGPGCESTELYAYCVCAVRPVELAKPALGYKEDEPHRCAGSVTVGRSARPGFVYSGVCKTAAAMLTP